jgi:hypothetical protein
MRAGDMSRGQYQSPRFDRAEPAARDIDFEDRDVLDAPAVALDGVNGRPRSLALGVRPDGGQLALIHDPVGGVRNVRECQRRTWGAATH